jgi:uncharacterized damage-inducible protein DinB
MHKKYILELFNYNFQVNQELLTVIKSLKSSNERLLQLLSHLVPAEKIWLMRLKDEDLLGQLIWPELSLNDAERLLKENQTAYADYLENISDRQLNLDLIYKNSKGEKFHTPIVDILMHVIIHGGYHRGQIAATIRQAGG